MTEALIVARTRYSDKLCIGGLRLDDNANVRLMTAAGTFQRATSPFKVGDVFDLEMSPAPTVEQPHVEDVRVASAVFVRHELQVRAMLENRVAIVHGGPEGLFQGKLSYTSTGRPYIGRTELPTGSVAFWDPDVELVWDEGTRRYVYEHPNDGDVKFTYAGEAASVPAIARGSLVRISLARWFPEGDPPEVQRCYTQVSGWFA
jgi:hypothetical protein